MKLLRALQEGEIRRVGCNQTQRVDVRVLAASNCDVEQEVEGGRFRKDLFYRLNAVAIVLPPLRDRPEDILPLATTFAKRVYSLNPKVGFSAEAVGMLESYLWPGNIRELENAVVRAVAMCDGTIRAQDLPERVRNYERSNADEGVLQTEESSVIEEEWLSLAQTEGSYVTRALAHVGYNKAAAARLLHVDRKTLDRMIIRHRISLGHVTKFPPAAG